MRTVFALLLGGLALVASGTSAITAAGAQSGTDPSALTSHRAILDRYCVTCHNPRLKTAGLTLNAIDLANVAGSPEIWEKVVRKLRAGAMPPPGAPRPD